MADREVRIIIAADVASAIRSIGQVENSLGRVGDAGEDAGGKAEGFGDKLKSGLEVAGVVTGLAGVAKGIQYVMTQGIAFQDNMNSLQAVTGANANEMAALSEKARSLGSDLDLPATSAGDAAEAMLELSKGGLTVSETMAAAKGSLLLAAAAQITGAEAASIQSNALNAFNLSASDANHVADVLANTANAASGEITDFAAGLQQSATVAHSFGIGIEDSATTLGLFAKAGIAGSDAGTSFKTMLTALASPTKQQQQALAELNLTVYDAQGNFVGMRSVTEQLAVAKANLTQQDYNAAASTAFGSDAIRAANILAEGGVQAWDDMATAVGRAGGAQELAAAQTQGLSGSFGKLMSGVEDFALTLFNLVEPAVTGVVDFLGGLAGGLGGIAGPALAAAGALAGLFVISKVVGFVQGLLFVIPTIIAGMGGLAGAMGGARAAMIAFMTGSGPWVLAIAGLAGGLAFLASKGDGAQVAVADLTGVVNANTGAMETNARAQIAVALSKTGTSAAYKAIGGNVGDLTAALAGNAAAADRVQAAILRAGIAAYEADPKVQSLNEKMGAGGQSSQEMVQALIEMGSAGFGTSDALNNVLKAANGFKDAQADISGQVAAGTLALEGMQSATSGAAEGFVAFGQSVPVSALKALHGDGETAASAVTSMGSAASGAAPTVDDLKTATEGLASAASFADSAVQFLTLALDAASGNAISTEQAWRAQEAALRGIQTAAADTAAAQDGVTAAQLRVTEASEKLTDVQNHLGLSQEEGGTTANDLAQAQLDLSAANRENELASGKVTDATDKQFEANIQAQQSALLLAFSLYQNTAANGNLTAAADVATASIQSAKDAFIQAQPEADRLSGKANQTADALFGIPKDTVARIAEQGAAATQSAANNTSAAVEGIPDSHTTTLSAIDNASDIAGAVRNAVDAIPLVKNISIGASVSTAAQSVLAGVFENGGMLGFENGGLHAADGLALGRGFSQVREGKGKGVTWAEEQTGREYYLSMKNGQEGRNRNLAAQAVTELGGRATFGGSSQTNNATLVIPPPATQKIVVEFRGDSIAAEMARTATYVVSNAFMTATAAHNRGRTQS